jgi:hypothetical protein
MIKFFVCYTKQITEALNIIGQMYRRQPYHCDFVIENRKLDTLVMHGIRVIRLFVISLCATIPYLGAPKAFLPSNTAIKISKSLKKYLTV